MIRQLDIFKENINVTLNFSDVYLDNDNVVKDLNGKLQIVDNKVISVPIYLHNLIIMKISHLQ